MADAVFWISGVLLVVAGMLPILVVFLIGLVQGAVPSESEGGIWGHAERYPAFDPQTWLLLLPAAGTLFLSIWTIPLPLRGFPSTSRYQIGSFAVTGMIVSLLVGTAFAGAPGIGNEGLFAVPLFAIAFVLIVVRGILGSMRALPRAWREATPTKRTRRASAASRAGA